MKRMAIALGALLACGAASAQDKPGPFAGADEKIAYLLASWEGRTADDVRRVWGRPSEEGASGSESFLLYEEDVRTRPGISIFGEVRVSRRMGTCRVTFEIDGEGAVTDARYRGEPSNCWDSFKRNEPLE